MLFLSKNIYRLTLAFKKTNFTHAVIEMFSATKEELKMAKQNILD